MDIQDDGTRHNMVDKQAQHTLQQKTIKTMGNGEGSIIKSANKNILS